MEDERVILPYSKKKRWQRGNILVSSYLLAYIILLQKKPSFNYKAEGSGLTLGIYNKETDGWTGHLSAEIIHGSEKEKQRQKNPSVSVCACVYVSACARARGQVRVCVF